MLEIDLRQPGPIPLDARFSCAPGETLALVGPSGSGKTTILKAIAGLYRVANGRVRIGDNCWFDSQGGVNLPARMRKNGFVFQSYALFPHLTALENIMEAMDADASTAMRQSKANELLSAVNLAGLDNRLPHALSGGQQQRVALARALAREPDVLLLDEPFSAVDQATREKLYEELANLRRNLKMPVVLVTHSLPEAMLLADRMCVLHHGRTLQTGTPEDVMNRPASIDVARLISMKNIFTARVASHETARFVTILDWHGLRLEASLQQAHAADTDVSWVIPSGSIVLHRKDRPSKGEWENPVACRVTRHVVMGDNTLLALSPLHAPDQPLTLTISTHVAQRNGVWLGVIASVSLLSNGIHVIESLGSADRASTGN
jgi:molybdate transport system ATP-binding protein